MQTIQTKTLDRADKKIGDIIELHGGRLEDFQLVEMAEAAGRIVPSGSLNERAADAKAFLEFLGWNFVKA